MIGETRPFHEIAESTDALLVAHDPEAVSNAFDNLRGSFLRTKAELVKHNIGLADHIVIGSYEIDIETNSDFEKYLLTEGQELPIAALNQRLTDYYPYGGESHPEQYCDVTNYTGVSLHRDGVIRVYKYVPKKPNQESRFLRKDLTMLFYSVPRDGSLRDFVNASAALTRMTNFMIQADNRAAITIGNLTPSIATPIT